ncbi:hypothetical protein F4778DRAFT_796376 [Xylariomycetidae sp. FL2044]|nr:hypothetical protein F4778DRAFT_796376 [Xylariomycetidae sp. FL2044]
MVYCGKPSRGCQMCRTRRIKCDETKPTCNQCAKSRRQCPGYKDEFDLVFRNETKATERRAQKANKKAMAQAQKAPRQGSLSPDGSPCETVSPVWPESIKSPLEQAVIPALKLPVEQQAGCHFVSNFILLPKEGTTHGFLDFIPQLLKHDGEKNHLQHAFNACSIAFLNNRANTGNTLSEKALHEYTKALNGTNIALRDSEAQKADSTLAAVLLLGLFESITAKQIGMCNWGSHTEGAIQLVKSRGRKQLRTKIGLSLFIAVRTQMIIHTLTTGKAPVMGAEWWITEAINDTSAANCQRLLIKTGDLRAKITQMMNSMTRTPDNIERMLEVIRMTQTVDQEVVSWMQNLPDWWQFKTVAWEDHVPNGDYAKAEVFPGRVDMYKDFSIASIWNMARTARLILASLIVRCAAWVCAPIDYRTTPEYATAARACVETITDIIASVPYQLGWHLNKPHILEKANMVGFACGEEDHIKGLAGYFLTWPLTCLNGQDYTTDAQRAWVRGRLAHVGNTMGVRYAHILNQLQIRIPSMLIRRDGLMALPYGAAHNFEQLIAARNAPSVVPGYALNPLQQREAMQKEQFDKGRAELIAKATGQSLSSTSSSATGRGNSNNKDTQWVAKQWLVV